MSVIGGGLDNFVSIVYPEGAVSLKLKTFT